MSATPLSRRNFLLSAAGAGVAGAAALTVGRDPLERVLGLGGVPSARPASGAPAPFGTNRGILVVVTLYGGNDGLNTVIPYTDSAYSSGRPTLGYGAHEVQALDDRLGLHPNLAGLKKLWDAKRLAIVLGVGYPGPNRSHFRSMDIWQSAVPETDEITGWLGRWLDITGTDPMRALSIGPTLPKLLQGKTAAAGAVPPGAVGLPGGDRLAGVLATLSRTTPDEAALAARVAQSGADLLTVARTVGEILASQPGSEPASTGARASGLGSQLDVVGRLIKGGSPTQVYSVSLGGFDTHATEKDNHARLMAELDAGISGLLGSLEGSPQGDHVVVMTASEFGRRVAANASGGTDHGTAAPLFVAGRNVKGGFYGEQPSLTDLDQGDLRFSTDFRSVYATVLATVLGADPKAVLANQTFPTLGFV